MSREEQGTSNSIYYQVFDGAFRTRVRQDTPDAIRRVNKKGVEVFEREVRALFGKIENIALEDSDFGQQIKIILDANEQGKHPVLTFGVESKNGRDVLRKLPAIDFAKEVRIMPYRFTPEDTEVSGISFTQQDDEGKFTVKVENHFFDQNEKKYLHDFPVIDWDATTDSEQKIYKIKRDEFLVNYLKDKVLPRFAEKPAPAPEYPTEDITPDDIPF